jgi:hypothetical protein
MRKLIVVLLFVFGINALIAQELDSVGVPINKLKLFFECQDCDQSYFMNQMTFVDFVRNVEDGDVHLYVTKQKNASEGFRYYLNFVGKEKFGEIKFKLQTDSPESESSLKRNDRILKYAKLGLAPYISQTNIADRVNIKCDDSIKVMDRSLKDPWDYWVFVMDLGGSLDAEYSLYNYKTKGRFVAKRITETWKHRLVLDYSYENETYDYRTNEMTQSIKKGYTIHSRSVYSINSHWSAQISEAIKQDTYYNYDFYWDIGPAIEYNFFPWDKSDRKVFAAIYQIKARYYDYIQPSVNNLGSDLLVNHSASLELILRQPWGDIESMLEYNAYIPQWDMYRLSLEALVSVKIARGFSIFFKADGTLINDQHYLPKEASSLSQRLLQARQEKTPFELAGQIGIRYAFGSIYNSVVNHRF